MQNHSGLCRATVRCITSAPTARLRLGLNFTIGCRAMKNVSARSVAERFGWSFIARPQRPVVLIAGTISNAKRGHGRSHAVRHATRAPLI
jgi:hypothetical protein